MPIWAICNSRQNQNSLDKIKGQIVSWRIFVSISASASNFKTVKRITSMENVFHTSMENISAEVSIFCPWTNWIHLVTCSKIEFRDLHCYSRWTKSLKFTLSIAVHGGGLAKNHFWLVTVQKKRIGEQLNYFWNMCPKPFS